MSITGLPDMDIPFHFQTKGEITGKVYEGDFVYRRLNRGMKTEASKYSARLSGDLQNLDEETLIFNRMLGFLNFALPSYPSWWADCKFGNEIYDDNVIVELWKKVHDLENAWIEKVWAKEPTKPTPKE